jgi:hypothetical protein
MGRWTRARPSAAATVCRACSPLPMPRTSRGASSSSLDRTPSTTSSAHASPICRRPAAILCPSRSLTRSSRQAPCSCVRARATSCSGTRALYIATCATTTSHDHAHACAQHLTPIATTITNQLHDIPTHHRCSPPRTHTLLSHAHRRTSAAHVCHGDPLPPVRKSLLARSSHLATPAHTAHLPTPTLPHSPLPVYPPDRPAHPPT